MEVRRTARALRHARRARNLIAVAALILLTANFLLSFKLWEQSNQVVLVPTSVSDGMVARGAVDKAYVEALALDAVYAMYNTSPGTLRYGRTVLERLSAPQERAGILDSYDKTGRDITAREISTVFLPRKLEHNFARYEVVVEGELATYLETVPVSRDGRRILVRFTPQAGSIRLSYIGILEQEENEE